jgi:hypothetical protein
VTPEFKAWPKIPRFNRDVVITEKIDGTNACVVVTEEWPDGSGDFTVHAQSRKRIITPEADNYGFAAWVQENEDELRELGPGYHYGEWYGRGIQRGYGLDERRFALFNPDTEDVPPCCEVVPVLGRTTGRYASDAAYAHIEDLRRFGSVAVPEYMQPEGIVIYHTAARQTFKVLLEGDDFPKGVVA